MQHIRQLQKSAESHSTEITTMHDSMQKIMTELQSLSRTADIAAASAIGTDRQETVAKMSHLLDRIGVLQQVCYQPSLYRICMLYENAKNSTPDHRPPQLHESDMQQHCIVIRCSNIGMWVVPS